MIGPFLENPEKVLHPPFLDEQGRFVLAFRRKAAGKGWWWLGGRERPGELPEQSLTRILLREIGFVPKDIRPLASFHHLWDERGEVPADCGRHDLIQLFLAYVSEKIISRIRLDPEEYDAEKGLLRYDGTQEVRTAVASSYRFFSTFAKR